jgi:alpha-1,2-mannosyltransferase
VAPPPAQAPTAGRTWWTRAIRLGLAAFALAAALAIADKQFLDLQVYRDAGRAYLNGVPLFGTGFTGAGGLRFIYGPIAAVLVVPFTLLPDMVAWGLWTMLSVALLWWVLRTVCERLGLPGSSATAVTLLAPALLIGPVRDTLGYGQINIIMMALVVLDVAGVIPRRFRGVGIGIAAAIKVTPAAFGLLLLVRKDYPSVVRAAGAFLLAAALGFLFAPADSRVYWTSEFFNTDRGGPHLYGPNQAVTGLLARMGLGRPTEDIVWMVSVVVIVAAAAYSARKFTVAGEHVLAMGVVALAALLAAPLAVSHHWVYIVILLPLLLAPQYASWRCPLGAAAGVFFVSAQNAVPIGGDRELSWSLTEQLLGNSEGITGIALLAAAVILARTRRPSGQSSIVEPEAAGVAP